MSTFHWGYAYAVLIFKPKQHKSTFNSNFVTKKLTTHLKCSTALTDRHIHLVSVYPHGHYFTPSYPNAN